MNRVTALVSLYFLFCASHARTQVFPGVEPQKRMSADTAKIWYSVGMDYFKRGEYSRAIANFKTSISYDTSFIEAYLSMAQAYIFLNSLDSALLAYEKVNKIDSTDTRGWQGLGFIYGIGKNDPQKGIEYYRKALDFDPTNTDAMYGLANLYQKIGETHLADSLYENAYKRDTTNYAIAKAYGLFLYENKRFEKALKYLEIAFNNLNSKDLRLLEALSETYITLGEKSPPFYRKALEILNTMISIDSLNIVFYLKKSDVLLKLKEKKSSLEALDKAISILPTEPQLYLRKASILIDELKDYSGARLVLERIKDYVVQDDLKAIYYSLYAETYFRLAEDIRKDADELRNKGFEKESRKKYSDAVNLYDQSIIYYEMATKFKDTPWGEYATKQLRRTEELRKRAWRRSQGIE